MPDGSLPFREIWLCDFEFRAPEGERPWPVCMVAREHLSGREVRLWRDDLVKRLSAPFSTDRDALFVAYFSSAELGCFLELGWSLLRLTGLAIGADGRNRTLLSPFGARSGRNTPSNSKFVFGPAVWMRGLIRPPRGHGLAYMDWSGQEIAIAAALSGDERMIEGYQSGDPHMAFAKAARLAPADATALTHPAVRESCKTTNLGINYGMSAVGLALRLGVTPAVAQELLRKHHETYHRFWVWVEETVSSALLSNNMVSLFGWRLHIGAGVNPRSLQNFPMQSNGAEMMRIAAIAATEAGMAVAAPVHDAFLIVSPLERLNDDILQMRQIMRKAGLAVTGGLEVRVDAKVVRHPERYMDNRGVAMWSRARSLLGELSLTR